MHQPRLPVFSFVLGILALVAVGFSHLALTDIAHGEGDLSLEWTVLRICFAIIVVAQISALWTLWKIHRRTTAASAYAAD